MYALGCAVCTLSAEALPGLLAVHVGADAAAGGRMKGMMASRRAHPSCKGWHCWSPSWLHVQCMLQEHPPDRQNTLLARLGETTIPSDIAPGAKRAAPEGSLSDAPQEDVTRKQDASEGPGLISSFWESTGVCRLSCCILMVSWLIVVSIWLHQGCFATHKPFAGTQQHGLQPLAPPGTQHPKIRLAFLHRQPGGCGRGAGHAVRGVAEPGSRGVPAHLPAGAPVEGAHARGGRPGRPALPAAAAA